MKQVLQICFFLLFGAYGLRAQTITVNVSVDVSNETVDASGVHVAGNWDSNNEWNPGAFPMNDNGDGTWSLDLTVAENDTFEYKFLLGNDWPLGNESIDGNAGCIVGNGNSNRVLTVGDQDMVLDTVCYNQCAACADDGESQVTFKVDLSKANMINSPIYLSGSFPDAMWNETYVMRDDNNDQVYTTTLVLPEGDYSYKFRNGADGWEGPPSDCTTDGNRTVSVGADDTILDAVCLGECGPCVVKNVLNVTMAVDMTNVILADGDVSDLGVHVAGTFQEKAGFGSNWTPRLTMLSDDDGDNIYTVSFELEEGTYEFKFLNGDDWGTEESVPEACRVNGNREVSIAGNSGDAVTIGPFCFGECEAECPELLDPINVTFRVDMSNEFVSGDGLFVAGDFIANAKWVKDTFEMVENSMVPGIYEYTANFRPGSAFAYKFFNGGMDGGENGEETHDFIAAGCGVDNGFGGSNRTLDLTMVTEDIVLPAYIFNSCDVSTLVSANDITYFEAFSTYPNPASNELTVAFESNSRQMHKVQLYNTAGALVYESAFSYEQTHTILRNGLKSGLYIGRVINEEEGTKAFKVMFQ